MPTRFVTSFTEEDNSFEAGKRVAQGGIQKIGESRKPDLIILFSAHKYNHPEVVRGIRSVVDGVPIIGCTTAGQFSEEGAQKEGISCAMLASSSYCFHLGVGRNLKENPLASVQQAIESFPKEKEGFPYHSAIVFIDALASSGEEAVLAASSLLGPLVKFAGGAAGDELKFKDTRVFFNEEALTDAITICMIFSRTPLVISAKHGHKPISPPLRITKAEGNILYEVENRPAFEVWKQYIKEPLQQKGVDIDKLSGEEIAQVLLKYEAGLLTGSDYKMRFPASVGPDGSLNFVSGIVEGAVLKIMDSEEQDQINSARQAAEEAVKFSRNKPLAGALIFDCACRALILKENFQKAIDTYASVLHIPFAGGETYGEIAMEMGQLSGFHNTTSVLMLFPA